MSEPTALAFDEREYTLAELDALANGMATLWSTGSAQATGWR